MVMLLAGGVGLRPPCARAAPSSPAAARGEFDYLVVSWGGGQPDFWSEVQVRGVCSAIAEAMTSGKALWGLGVFRSYGCYLDGRLIAGAAGESPWVLLLDPGPKAFTIGLYRQPDPVSGRAGRPMHGAVSPRVGPKLDVFYELSVTPPQRLPAFLRDKDHARLLTAPFVLSLPAVARATLEDAARGYMELLPESFDARVAAVAPPHRVELRTLNARGGTAGLSAELGRGVLAGTAQTKWTWVLYDTLRRYPSDDFYISIAGAAVVRADVAATLMRVYASAVQEDDPFVMSSALSGAVDFSTYASSEAVAPFEMGVRYGRDVLGSEAEFGVPITFFGAVVESRSGIIKGFRGYYDNTPTITNPRTQEQYGARRIQLGRAFDFKLPRFIDRIVITPQIGQWDVQSRVMVIDPNHPAEEHVFPIRIARALSFGIEGGAEFSAVNFVGRLWGSRDTSGGKLSRYSGGKVDGSRFGFDGIYRLTEIGGRRSGRWLAPMVFVLKEDVSLVSDHGDSFQRNGQTIAFDAVQISYAMTYVGGGLGLIW